MKQFFLPSYLSLDTADILNAVIHDYLMKAADNIPKYLLMCTDNAADYLELHSQC